MKWKLTFYGAVMILTIGNIAFNYAMSIAFIEAQTRKELSLLEIIGEGLKIHLS